VSAILFPDGIPTGFDKRSDKSVFEVDEAENMVPDNGNNGTYYQCNKKKLGNLFDYSQIHALLIKILQDAAIIVIKRFGEYAIPAKRYPVRRIEKLLKELELPGILYQILEQYGAEGHEALTIRVFFL